MDDLGARNRLIHIPLKTKNIRAIEIVDAKTSDVFALLGEGKRFAFLPGDSVASTDDAALAAGTLAQPAAVDVNPSSRQQDRDKRLKTKLSPEALQKRLLDIWCDARTLEEVGKQFNVTRERIRQIESKALRKMRHPTRVRQLQGFLEFELIEG